jgi:hypothetical protein
MRKIVTVGLIIALATGGAALAQDKPSDETLLKQANNPLATFKAFNIHNYYAPDLYGLPDEKANTAWLRFVVPIGRWVTRFSLPLPTRPVPGDADPQSGLGDLNGFAAYLFNKPENPKQFGVGPLLVAPTATDDALGAGKWQAGAAAVYFDMSSPKIQWGGLVTLQASFAGDSDRSDTQALIAQPFMILQLGKGTYLRSAPIWTFDLENDVWNVPLGVGIGKVTKVNRTVFNIFIEPQWTILHDGIGQPAFQLFAGINMQFISKPKKSK